jgi:hypothetical protein
VTSIILKWKKFGTNKTLPQVGCPAKLSNQRRALVREFDQEPDGHSDRAPEFLCGDGRTRRTTISVALHHSGLYGRVARRKPLLSKRRMTARLEFAKKHLKDSYEKKDSLI